MSCQMYSVNISRNVQIYITIPRDMRNLNLAKNKKCFSDKTVRTSGPILWNSMTEPLKITNSSKHFRLIFKQSLISKYK